MASKKPSNSPLFEQMFGKSERKGRVVSYEGVDPSYVARLVVAVVDSGCAVLFGTTRDRGAWAMTFMGDPIPGGKSTTYQSDEDELNDWLLEWVENWEGIAEEGKSAKAVK